MSDDVEAAKRAGRWGCLGAAPAFYIQYLLWSPETAGGSLFPPRRALKEKEPRSTKKKEQHSEALGSCLLGGKGSGSPPRAGGTKAAAPAAASLSRPHSLFPSMATATATGLPNGLPTETPPTTVTPPSIHSSRYVGDLDRDVEERSLFELFSQVSVLSARFPPCTTGQVKASPLGSDKSASTAYTILAVISLHSSRIQIAGNLQEQ